MNKECYFCNRLHKFNHIKWLGKSNSKVQCRKCIEKFNKWVSNTDVGYETVEHDCDLCKRTYIQAIPLSEFYD